MPHPQSECTFEKAVEHLYYWQHGGDSFACMLFTLMQKADEDNQRRLYQGFPVHFTTWQLWNNYETQDDFFEDHLKVHCSICNKLLSYKKGELRDVCLDCKLK
ncbi:MAG: hypothetical protein H7836_04275 [Magnetococcus sp. YQC-3]